MDVKNYKVYRIIRESPETKPSYNIGQILEFEEYQDINFNNAKQDIEAAFEAFRQDQALPFPSRKDVLYVYPSDPAELSVYYENRWLEQKFRHNRQAYILLTLSLTGKLYWFDAEHFDKYGETMSPDIIRINGWSVRDVSTIQNSCLKSYWHHIQESEFTKDMLIEGLFVGKAIVVDVEKKAYNS